MKLPSLPSFASGPRLPAPVVAIGGIVLLAVALTLALLRWGDRLPPAILWVGGAILLGTLLLWLVLRGWPLWREQRFLRQFKEEFGGGAGAADPEPRRDLRLAAEEAVATIRDLDPKALHTLPWLFVLGDSASARALLGHATRKAPLPRPDHAAHPDRLWHHWFLEAGVAVELADRFICPRTDAATRRLWLEALLTANRLRPQMPVHGLVLLIPVESLSPTAGETRQELVVNLRRVIDEILRTLSVDIPVHVLVSGIDRLEGAETFLNLLPEETRNQALGHGFADGMKPDAAVAAWTGAFDTICTTLYRLQLSMLADTDMPSRWQAIHAFPGRVEKLREPLDRFLKGLFETGSVQLQRTARLRGVYFVGSGSQPVFADDLFTSLAPRDGSLARSTGGTRQRRRRLAFATAGAALALSALAVAAILWPVSALEDAHRQAMETCLAGGGAGDLTRLTDCAGRIAAFDTAAAGIPFGSRQARMDMDALRGVWTVAWRTAVADGLYNAMKQDLERGFGVRLAVLEQLSLLEVCSGGSGTRCTEAAAAAGEMRTRLDLMGVRGDQLLAAHLSYIAWLPGAERTTEHDRLLQLRDQGWKTAPPTIADLLAWANGLAKPRYLSGFWERPGREDSRPLGGAFMAEAWSKGISPAFDLIAAQAGNGELATRLVRDFHRARQEEWGRFLGRFGEGASLWAEDNTGLKNLLADRDRHPFEVLRKELQAAVLSTTPDEALRPWARVMKDALVTQWPQASGRLLSAAGTLAQATDAQTGFEMAADAFKAGGSPGAHGSQPLWLTIEQFKPLRDQLGPDAGQDDHAALDVLDAAPRTLLRVAMQEAVVRVNNEWNIRMLPRIRSLPPAQISSALGGEQGEMARFIQDWLSPFLTTGSSLRPRRTMTLELSLDPVFVAFAEQARQPGTPQGPLPVGTLSVTAASRVGQIMEGPQGTQVEMVCEQSIFTATSPGMTMPRRVNLLWKRGDCTEIRVTVSLPTDLGQGEPLLIYRSWTGENALELFAQDFSKGRQDFPLSTFKQDGLTAEVRQRLRETAGGADAVVTVAAEIQLVPNFNAEKPGTKAVPDRVVQPVL